MTGGEQHPGQHRRRAERVGAAEEAPAPGAGRPPCAGGAPAAGRPTTESRSSAYRSCRPAAARRQRTVTLGAEVLVEVEVGVLAPAVAVDDGERDARRRRAARAAPAGSSVVRVEHHRVQLVPAGRRDQLRRRVRRRVQRECPARRAAAAAQATPPEVPRKRDLERRGRGTPRRAPGSGPGGRRRSPARRRSASRPVACSGLLQRLLPYVGVERARSRAARRASRRAWPAARCVAEVVDDRLDQRPVLARCRGSAAACDRSGRAASGRAPGTAPGGV